MYLLDTNVVSELRRADRADRNVRAWAEGQTGPDLYLSVITILEIEHGTLRIERKDAVQGKIFRSWVDLIMLEFAGHLLPIDEEVAVRCARLHVPDRRPDRDALIAATALVQRLTIVTRNTRDFEGTGAMLLNPWLAQ